MLGVCLAMTPPLKIFSVPRDAAGRKKKQNKKKIIKIRGSATKGLVSTRHANFTIKKKFYKRRPHPQPLYIQFSFTGSSPSQKLSLLEGPPEPLKCLASAVQELRAPSFSATYPLFFFLSAGSVRRFLRQNSRPHILFTFTAFYKA